MHTLPIRPITSQSPIIPSISQIAILFVPLHIKLDPIPILAQRRAGNSETPKTVESITASSIGLAYTAFYRLPAEPRCLYRVAQGYARRNASANAAGIINSGPAAVTGQSLPTTTTWPKTWSLATWEQFQRWCLNWCRHSRSPSSVPSPTAGIACGAFLHCSRWLFARPGIRPQTAAPTTTAPTTLQPSRFHRVRLLLLQHFSGLASLSCCRGTMRFGERFAVVNHLDRVFCGRE